MSSKISLVLPAFLLALGCATVDRYVNADAPPGGIVTGTSQFDRIATDLDPFRGSGDGSNTRWTRIRVIASPGAICRVTGQSMFVSTGPEPSGRADERGEVMLTYDYDARSAAFECTLNEESVRREVKAVPYDITYRGRVVRTVHVKPPLVHMDPTDISARSRWDELEFLLCSPDTAYSTMCAPGMWEKLRTVDLGPAAGGQGESR